MKALSRFRVEVPALSLPSSSSPSDAPSKTGESSQINWNAVRPENVGLVHLAGLSTIRPGAVFNSKSIRGARRTSSSSEDQDPGLRLGRDEDSNVNDNKSYHDQDYNRGLSSASSDVADAKDSSSRSARTVNGAIDSVVIDTANSGSGRTGAELGSSDALDISGAGRSQMRVLSCEITRASEGGTCFRLHPTILQSPVFAVVIRVDRCH